MDDENGVSRAAWESEMFRLLAANVLDYAVFIVAPDRRVLSWGKGAERLLGFTESEVVGQRSDLFFTPEDAAAGVPQKELDEALATGKGANDRWHVRKDGTRFWSSGSVTPLRDAAGTLRGFAAIMRDRTDLKRDGEALNDALGYAAAVVATVREPLVVLDGDLRVRTANRSFYQTFRVRPEDTEGRQLYDLGNGQWDIPALRTLLGEVLPRDAAFNDFEVGHDFPGIGPKVMLLNARKLWREGEHTELILLAIEDVTALREAERARRDAEARFTEMVKNVRDHSIFLTDANGIITSWNVAAERIIGYTEAEAVGKPFSLIFTSEDIEARVPEEELRQAREDGRAEDERWHRRKDGSVFWALGIVTPLHDPDGRLSGYSKILRDMTEWKRADEATRERERQLELVTDIAPVLLAHCDTDFRFKFVNRPYAERFGLHPRDLIGKTIAEALGGEAFALIESHAREALAGRRVEYEADVPYDGIGTRTMRVAYEPERDGGGRVVGWVAAILDITDRKRAEEELAASRQRLQALFDNSLDAILLADDDARYVDANPAASALLGYDRDELLRHGVFDLTPAANGDAGRAAWAAFVGNGRQAGEYALARRDGSTAVVEFRAVANVRPGLHLSVLRDVTERRRTEEALRESRERLVEAQRIAGLGSWEIDWPTQTVRWSDEMYRLFAVTPGEFEPTVERFLAAVPADDHPAIERAVADALAGRTTYRVDHRIVRTDGAVRVVSEQAEFTFGPTGEPLRLTGTMLDITDRRAATEAVRASEERLRLALAASDMMAWETDLRADRTVGSDGAERLWGFRDGSADDYLAQIHPDDHPAVLKAWREGLEGDGDYAVEYRVLRPDGERCYLSRGHFLRDGTGTPTRIVGITADLTQQRRAEVALRESERRLRTLSDNLPLGAVYQVLADREGRRQFLYISAGVERLFGVTAAEAVADAATLYGLVHEADRPRVAAAEEVALRDNAPFDCEFRSRTRGGELRWFHCRSAPRRLPAGEVVWEGVIMDVTDRREADRKLREQYDLTRTITDTVTTAIFLMDADGRTTFMNPAAEAMTGFGFEEIKGLILHDQVHHHRPDGSPFPMADCPIGRHALGRRVLRGHEDVFVRKDGTFFPVRCAASPILQNGTMAGVVLEAQDITEPKRAEELLREADRRKDEFLATLAHELRNPLAPIRTAIQILNVKGPQDADARRVREMVERQVNHMVRLVDDLLDVSRISRGKIDLRRRRVGLAEVVQSAAETSGPVIEGGRHRLALSVPPEPLVVDGDAVRLTQVVANLLNNAAKYTPEGGDIAVTVERRGGEGVVRVRDTGLGIPSDMLDKVFEMFTQVNRHVGRSQGGLGIGLTLVKRLVELHGGSITARSEGDGRGAEFEVRLPLAGPGGGATEAPAAAPRATPRRIVVVDDNADAADSLAMLLSLAGHEVRTAHDGPSGVEQVGAFGPDVILLDLGMPGVDGYETARRVRATDAGRRAVLVALSGWGQEDDRRRTREAGFDLHMVKPVDPAGLEKLLASLPEGSGTRGATT